MTPELIKTAEMISNLTVENETLRRELEQMKRSKVDAESSLLEATEILKSFIGCERIVDTDDGLISDWILNSTSGIDLTSISERADAFLENLDDGPAEETQKPDLSAGGKCCGACNPKLDDIIGGFYGDPTPRAACAGNAKENDKSSSVARGIIIAIKRPDEVTTPAN